MADAQRQLEIVISARDEASRKIEGIGGKIGSAFKIVAAAGAAAGAAVAAFAVKSIADFSTVGDAVEKMSERTGLGAKAVSALRVAADASGTSIEAIEGAVKKMQLNMAQAEDGTYAISAAMRRFGITLFEDFPFMTSGEQFEFLAQKIGVIEDPALRTQAAVEAFGKSGADLIPLFEDGSFSMEAWSQKAQELGVSFDDLSASKAAALNDALGAMKTAVQGLALQVGGALAPAVTNFVNNGIVPMLPKLQELVAQGFSLVQSAVQFVTEKVQALWAWLQQTGIIDAIKDAFLRLWDSIQNSLWPALLKVWDALQPYMPFLQSLAAFIGASLLFAFSALVDVLALLFDILGKVIEAIASLVEWVGVNALPVLQSMKSIVDGLTGAWKGLTGAIGDAVDKIKSWVKSAKDAIFLGGSGIVSGISSKLSGLFGGGKAEGGPVESGVSYMVGERGPELFTPFRSGIITPNRAFAGANAFNVSISVGSVSSAIDIRRMAEMVGSILVDKVRANQRI